MEKEIVTAEAISTWTADADHSRVRFKVKHMMIADVHGEFTDFKAKVDFDENDITNSHVVVTINTPSVTTYNEKRDTHLKSSDFFDIEKYPTITFKSKKITKNGDKLTMSGDLTIHGITKEVSLDIGELSQAVKDPWGGWRMAASATGNINRYDFGLNWNVALEAGGVLVGEKVTMMIEVELVKRTSESDK
jgi:polyisoprenoid-binding protein YceI